MMKKRFNRVWAILLCFLLLLGTAPAASLTGLADWLSVTANAVMETISAEDVQSIDIFWPILEEHNVSFYSAYPKLQNHTVNQPCSSAHNGIDIWTGTNNLIVSAVADGVVDDIWTTKTGVYAGNQYIRIKHENLYKGTVYSLYCHLNGYYDGIQKGTVVKAGDPIAYSGNSGNVEYHLHFSMFRTTAYFGASEQVIDNNPNTGVFRYAYEACITGTCGDNLTWRLHEGNGELIISGEGEMCDFLRFNPVPWYSYKLRIKAVKIENGVTSIGVQAFSECENLTQAILPDSVTSIGGHAFHGCTSLMAVTLSNRLISIGEGAFFQCTSLTEFSIPDSVTFIGEGVFGGCTNLSAIHVGTKNTACTCDNDRILYNQDRTVLLQYLCTNSDETFKIPTGVKRIGEYSFLGCKSLTRISFPSSLTDIGNSAFSECTNLAYISLPDSLRSIDSLAFYHTAYQNNDANWTGDLFYIGHHLITARLPISGAVSIANGTLSIANGAFYSRMNLTSVTIPDSVVSKIGHNTFALCTNLTDIKIGCNVTGIDNGAFTGSGLIRVVLPSSVNTIGYNSFMYCRNLRSIHIPSQVTEIGQFVFSNCYNLEFICSDSNDCYAKTFAEKNGIEFRVCEGHDIYVSTVSIRDYLQNRTIDYRTTITFSVDPIQNPLNGASVHWFIDGKDKDTGETYTVKEAKQSYTVQAKYMKGDEVLAESEIETVTVKTGFFAKLKAFFRALFGRLPKEVQEAYDFDLFLNLLP